MKTNIYIDGFNLYYGCIKDTSYHWLDVSKMCRLLLPNDRIHRIKYFTALVSARPNDPEQPARQQLFLRALQTIPNLEIILGTFLSHEVKMPLFPIGSGYAKVIKTEEKGSDVNIATHLLVDGFRTITNLLWLSQMIRTYSCRFRSSHSNSKSPLAYSTRKSTPVWRYYRMFNSSRKSECIIRGMPHSESGSCCTPNPEHAAQ